MFVFYFSIYILCVFLFLVILLLLPHFLIYHILFSSNLSFQLLKTGLNSFCYQLHFSHILAFYMVFNHYHYSSSIDTMVYTWCTLENTTVNTMFMYFPHQNIYSFSKSTVVIRTRLTL